MNQAATDREPKSGPARGGDPSARLDERFEDARLVSRAQSGTAVFDAQPKRIRAEVRAGWCLPSDFGTNLIRPSSDSNTTVRPPRSVFAFAAFDGRAVARDATLDGNTFRSSVSIPKEAFVGDVLGGVAYGTTRWQFTYAQALRTKEFKGQVKSSVFGSISATFFY